MKFMVRTFVLLLIVNGFLLYMHFNESGQAIDLEEAELTYSQEIEVTNRPNVLFVRHHFSNLSEGRYELVWPDGSIDKSCSAKEMLACSRLDEKMTAFIEGEATSLTLEYVIPKNESVELNAIFNEPFVFLKNAPITSTTFHMTDETDIGGLWVNGLKLIGTKKLENVSYSFYQGTGKVTDLYWQQNELPLLFSGDTISLWPSR